MSLLARVPRISNKLITASSIKFSTVASQTIHINFVDREGARARVPALVGQSLLDVAQHYKVDLEGTCGGDGAATEVNRTKNWDEYIYGEGPQCFHCHVQIPKSFTHLLPLMTEHEHEGIDEEWEEEYQKYTSRLACQIKLEQKHDGLIVLVPDAPIVSKLI